MFDAFRYFTLAVAHGTFTAAARHAHVTQPALTAAIQRLEGELGARLFVRGRGGCTLTAAGEALLPRARAALAAVEDGRRAVAEVSGLTAGRVRVGAGATVCSYYLPAVLARFRAAYPGVQILVREAPHEAILAEVDAGELDLDLSAFDEGGEETPTEGPSYETTQYMLRDVPGTGSPGESEDEEHRTLVLGRGAGTEIDEMVGAADGLLVVLDHQQGVAPVTQFLQGVEQQFVVAWV